jgi:hypothetical protein
LCGLPFGKIHPVNLPTKICAFIPRTAQFESAYKNAPPFNKKENKKSPDKKPSWTEKEKITNQSFLFYALQGRAVKKKCLFMKTRESPKVKKKQRVKREEKQRFSEGFTRHGKN